MNVVLKNKWFYFGLLLKIILLFFGGSKYFQELFIPFLDLTITHLGKNPWSMLPTNYFPYGSVLLLILAIPKLIFYLLFGEFALGNQALSFFSVKIMILTTDLMLFRSLLDLTAQRESKLVWFYWLNPILFYICYIHVQLDIFSMFFVILAILQLYRGKPGFSGVLLAMATLCKFHVLIVMPFMLAYLWNINFRKAALLEIAKFSGVFLILAIVGFLPQLFAHNFDYISVGSPEAMSLFAAQIRFDQHRVIYIGFLLSVALLARLCVSTRITREGLFYGAGSLFGTLILGSSAMAGWYFWFYPFVAIFYSTRSNKFNSLLYLSYIFYFTYFVLIARLPGEHFVFLGGVVFSLLQLTILGLLISLWYSIVHGEAPLLKRTRPMLIGLAGNSGSGKNSITSVLSDLFGESTTTIMEGDDYHKWARGHCKWQDYTHLNPKANFLDEMAEHTQALITGKLVFQPHYDHSTGSFTLPRPIEASKNMILQGLHTFYLKSMRNQFDIKIFMSPDEELRIAWKVLRDVGERGHTFEKVMDSIQARAIDSVLHISPQKKIADWVVEYKLYSSGGFDLETITESPSYYVRHIVWNDTPLNRLSASFHQKTGTPLNIEINNEDIDKVAVRFDGPLTSNQVEEIANSSFDYLRHLTRSYIEPRWNEGQNGFAQLIALALIERKLMRRVN